MTDPRCFQGRSLDLVWKYRLIHELRFLASHMSSRTRSSRDQGYIQPGKCSVHVFFCFYSIHEFTVNNENSNYDGHEEGHKTVHAGG